MRKIGFDAQVLQGKELAGYGYYVRGLWQALEQAQTKELSVVALNSRWARDLSTVERFRHDRFEVAQLAETAGVDVIHQPCFSAPKSRKKVIWTLHDLRQIVLNERMSLPASLYWKKWLPYSARYADVVVCTSENTRRDAVKYLGLKESDIPIIPVGVPQEAVTWHLASESKKAILDKFGVTGPYFCTLGTLQPIKNIPFLIEVMAALRQEYRLKHQLVIIGKKGWDYDNVKRALQTHKLVEGQDVVITGYVSDDEKWALMQESEAFLFPSLYEGFGIPPLEAQALGVPVLCSDNSSLPEVVGDAALLCSATDTKTWLKAYDALSSERTTLIARGKANVKRYYWDVIASQWLTLYKTV